MEAIVLAGGFGTRLRKTISDLPKPMAPIGDKPFLYFVLEHLLKYKIKKVILSVGYMHQSIIDYFGFRFGNVELEYCIENEPLGTGGAIKKSLERVEGHNVYIINGDTYFDVNLKDMAATHILHQADLTIALKPMQVFDRYGTVLTKDSKVIRFEEKRFKQNGDINGGTYYLNSQILDKFELPSKFSFEIDFLEKYIDVLNFHAFVSNGYFIDIGVPEDYEKAQLELMNRINE